MKFIQIKYHSSNNLENDCIVSIIIALVLPLEKNEKTPRKTDLQTEASETKG